MPTIDQYKEAVALLRSALPDSDTGGPDGTGYEYVWDELTGDEQEWVKQIRQKVALLIGPPEP